MRKAVVVGGGFGGLSAAIELAASNWDVTLVESREQLGGKAGTVTIDGVRLDTGPSVLTLPDTFDRVLKRAGTSLLDEVTLVSPSPAFRYYYPDQTFLDIYDNFEQSKASVAAALGSSAANEFENFLRYCNQIWDAAAPTFVYGPAPSPSGLLKLGLRGLSLLGKIDPLRTMLSGIQKRVKSEALVWLFMRYATYNGSDPRRAPATLNCIAHVELSLGGYGVAGGIHSLVEALHRAGQGLGVRYLLNTKVSEILTSSSGVVGVRLASGEVIESSVVVANADANHVACDLLSPAAGKSLKRKAQPSMSGYNAILKCAQPRESPRVAHTVIFPRDYLQEFEDIFDHNRAPLDPTVYACAPVTCHNQSQWEAHEPLFVMANVPSLGPQQNEAHNYGELKQRVFEQLERFSLMEPDDELVWERTPNELAALFPGSAGAIYGAASNSQSAAFRRPANRVRQMPGLYLASGTSHPGGGIPLAMLSGVAAREAIEQDGF